MLTEYALRLAGIFACGYVFQVCYLLRKKKRIDVIECLLAGTCWVTIAILIAEYT